MRSEFTGSEQVSSLNHFAGTAGSTSQRASWNDNQKAHLLQVLYCFPRAHKGGWSKDVWENITDHMNRKFPKSFFTTQQLKQQEKDLHKLYKQVKEILKRPGFRWDTSNCMLEASNSCWIELSESRGKLSWSRRRIPYYHRLAALYEGYDAEVEPSHLVPLQSNSSSIKIKANMNEDGIASLSNSEENFLFFHGSVPNAPVPELVVVPSLDSGVINHRSQLYMSPDQDLDIILTPSNPISNLPTKKPDPQPDANYIKTQSSDLTENPPHQINDKTSCLATVFTENLVPSVLHNRMENHDYGDQSSLSNQMSRNNPIAPSTSQAFSEFPDHPSCIEISSVDNPQGNVSTINDNGMVNSPVLSAPQLISAMSSDKPAVLNASKGLMVNPNSNRTIPPAQKKLGNFSFLRQLVPNNTPSGVSSPQKLCEKTCPLINNTNMGHELNLSAPLNRDNASNSEQHGKKDSVSSDPEENPARKIKGKQFRKKKDWKKF